MTKSVAELEIMEFWNKLMEHDFISIKDFMNLGEGFSKLLEKCEELRKSRDNWRKKYEDGI